MLLRLVCYSDLTCAVSEQLTSVVSELAGAAPHTRGEFERNGRDFWQAQELAQTTLHFQDGAWVLESPLGRLETPGDAMRPPSLEEWAGAPSRRLSIECYDTYYPSEEPTELPTAGSG